MIPLCDNIETLKQTCHQEGTLMAPFAFSSLMIHWILQFTLRIAVRCVLHRCASQDIHRWKFWEKSCLIIEWESHVGSYCWTHKLQGNFITGCPFSRASGYQPPVASKTKKTSEEKGLIPHNEAEGSLPFFLPKISGFPCCLEKPSRKRAKSENGGLLLMRGKPTKATKKKALT